MDRTAILAQPPGTFVVTVNRTALEIVVREDGFRLARYPRQCSVDMKLSAWQRGNVVLGALMARLGKSNLTTFHRWINAATNTDQRILQALTRQESLEIQVIWDAGSRTFPWRNTLQAAARALISQSQSGKPWTPADFERERRLIDHELPTAHAAWWSEK
ncbi:MAG: hypothetical protein JNG88_08430 [Phycisphaerales bacterium]|nr:hypothetical protein [Phycisphaerales bacterium]